MTSKHFCRMTSASSNGPTVYRALCGFESTDRKAFVTPLESPDPAKVTCEGCKEYRGVVIAKVYE